MDEIKADKKIKIASIVLSLCGVLLFIEGIFLLKNGINRISFHLIGSSFFIWALAASPQIMFRRVLDKSKVQYTMLSKALFLGAALIFIAHLIIHFINTQS